MTEGELDRLFESVRREPLPELGSVAPRVMARIAAGRPRRAVGWRWWLWVWVWAAPAAAVAACTLLVWVWLAASRPPVEPPSIALGWPAAPAVGFMPPRVVKPRRPRVAPVAAAPVAPVEPATHFITRPGQTEVLMATRDPNIKIIWIAESEN